MLIKPSLTKMERFLNKYIFKKPNRLPDYCATCGYLKYCRRPEEEGWKCYNGCIILNIREERAHPEYEGLPRGCWYCKYLKDCRRPKEEGWKCYNGCRKIKKRA